MQCSILLCRADQVSSVQCSAAVIAPDFCLMVFLLLSARTQADSHYCQWGTLSLQSLVDTLTIVTEGQSHYSNCTSEGGERNTLTTVFWESDTFHAVPALQIEIIEFPSQFVILAATLG